AASSSSFAHGSRRYVLEGVAVIRRVMSFFAPRVARRRRASRWLAPLVLATLGWVAPGLHHAASAQTVTTCYPADEKGVDGPVDYGAYCWIDFTLLDLALAKSETGQPFHVNLRGGAYLTFDLRIVPGNTAGNNMFSVAVPSWSGAAFGNSAFNYIPGRPI